MQLWNNSQCCYVGRFSKGMSHLPVTYFQVSHLGDFHSSHPGPRETVLFFFILLLEHPDYFSLQWLWNRLGGQKACLLICSSLFKFPFFFFLLPSLAFIMANGGRSESTFWIRNTDKIPKRLLQWWLLTKRRIINHHLDEIPSCNAISRTHTPLSLSADRPCWYIRVCWPFCLR